MDDDDTLAAPAGARMQPLPVRPLSLRYVVGGAIGKGGMGEVHEARDVDVGRDVAVKRMRSASPAPVEVARFVREARVQGRLDHPAIVPVHDLGVDDDGRPYFTMKRLAGTTLAEILARDDAAAHRPRMLRAFVEVCLAIEFAHARNVVHRDLKPANVVLGDYGEVYVLDWGVARVLGEHDAGGGAPSGDEPRTVASGGDSDGDATEVGTILGTPGYMPPEQVRGDAGLDGRADIYALGCVLFEILAGEPLHPRGHAALASTLQGADARPSLRGAWVPPELEAACVRATALEPAARFASAREVGDAVQAYLDGDRDVQRRRELADAHVGAALAALERGQGAIARAEAMREAGRALALDPTSEEAARIVTRLMLDPPAETPPAVEAELALLDRAQMARQGRLAALALSSYAFFFPVILWFGVTSWHWVGAIYVAVAVSAAMLWWLSGRVHRVRVPHVIAALLVNTVVFVFAARVLGPYLIVPALATGAIAATASFPLLRDRYTWVWLAYLGAVLVPTLLEELGAWPRTTTFDAGEMVVRSPIIEIGPRLVVFLVAYVALNLYACGRFVRAIAVTNHDAQRRLQLQAWHLRQLVP